MEPGAKASTKKDRPWAVLAGAVVIATGLASSLSAPPVWAQDSGSPIRLAQLAAERTFDISAQPLTTALTLFGQQSGLQVTVHGTLPRDISAPEVRGTMTSEEALTRLLTGSGLTYAMADESTVAIQKPKQQSDGTIQLNPVRVEGAAANPNAMIGDPPPAYAGGQVGTGARLGVLGNVDVMDAPYNITSFTDKTIADQQARSLSDVFANDPSVRAVFPRYAGIDQIYIRGFLSANQDVAYNGLFGIASSASNVLAVEGFERVEVLKGASSLLYGMNPGGTAGGVVNLVPKRAGNVDITRLTTSYISDATFGGHVDVGRRFGPDNMFGVRINGLYRSGDTPVDRNEQETQLATLGFDVRGERARGSLDFGYQNQQTDASLRSLRLGANVSVPTPPESGSSYAQPWTFGKNENLFGMARGEFDIAPVVTAFGAIGFNRLRNEFLDSFPTLADAGTGAMNETAPFHSRTATDTWTGELGLRGDFETGPFTHRPVLSGTHYRQETGLAREAFAPLASNLYHPIFYPKPTLTDFPSDPPTTGETELTSVVVADTVGVFDDRIQLTAGARHQKILADSFSATTGERTAHYDESAITPAVGLVVKPMQNLSLYANYIESLSQGPTAPLSAENAGEVFAPFRSKQYELGLKYDFGQYAVTASLFQITRPSGATDPATNIFGIVGEQRNRGLELNAFGEPLEGVRLLGGVTFLDGELTETAGGVNDGKTAPGVPAVQLNIGGEWDVPALKGLTLTGRVIHTAKQYFDPSNTRSIPSWTRLDLGARYAFDELPLTIRFNVENVADEAYWASSVGTFGTGELSLGAPRTFLLSAQVDF